MALSIRKSEDIDRARLMSCAPARTSATKQVAFIKNIDFNVQKTAPAPTGRGRISVENAMVVLGANGKVNMYISPDFASSLDSYYDLYTLIFHELTHIVVGHLIEEKIEAQYKDDFWKTKKGNFIRIIANELLIKHIEHNVLEDDKYHEINKKTFGEDDLPYQIFWRGVPDEEIDDPFFLRLKRKVFSESDYSTQETARGLRHYLDQNEEEDEDQDSSEGSGEKQAEGGGQDQGGQGEGDGQEKEDGGNQQEDGQEGNNEQDSGEEEGGQQEGGNSPGEWSEEDTPDTIGSQSYIEGDAELNEALQEALEAIANEIDEAVKNKPSNPYGSKRGDIERLEDELEEYVVKNSSQVTRIIRNHASKPSVYGKIGNIVRDHVGRAEEQSVLPDYRTDKRAAAAYSVGKFTSHYKRRQAAVEKKFVVYYDISPSQGEYIPYCNEIIKRIKKDLWKNTIFTFSGRDNLQKVRSRRFTQLAKEGRVSQVLGDNSTDFVQVARHIIDNNFKKVIVITDNCAGLGDMRNDLKKHVKKQGHALVIVYTEKFKNEEALQREWEYCKKHHYGFAGVETKMVNLYYG